MNTDTLINIAQTFGISVVFCGALAWFVWTMYKNNRDDIKAISEKYETKVEECNKRLGEVTIALTQNTAAFDRLNDLLDKIKEERK